MIRNAKILMDEVVWKLSHINLKSSESKRGSAKRLARLLGVRSSTARGNLNTPGTHIIQHT